MLTPPRPAWHFIGDTKYGMKDGVMNVKEMSRVSFGCWLQATTIRLDELRLHQASGREDPSKRILGLLTELRQSWFMAVSGGN